MRCSSDPQREKKARYVTKGCGPDSKPGLNCSVYEPPPSELATEPAVCEGKHRGQRLGHREETIDGESTAEEQSMLDLNSSAVSSQHRVSVNPSYGYFHVRLGAGGKSGQSDGSCRSQL